MKHSQADDGATPGPGGRRGPARESRRRSAQTGRVAAEQRPQNKTAGARTARRPARGSVSSDPQREKESTNSKVKPRIPASSTQANPHLLVTFVSTCFQVCPSRCTRGSRCSREARHLGMSPASVLLKRQRAPLLSLRGPHGPRGLGALSRDD